MCVCVRVVNGTVVQSSAFPSHPVDDHGKQQIARADALRSIFSPWPREGNAIAFARCGSSSSSSDERMGITSKCISSSSSFTFIELPASFFHSLSERCMCYA